MPTTVKDFNLAELTLICIAAISGSLGGCTVVANNVLRGKRMQIALCMSYLIIGAGFGLLAFVYGTAVGLPEVKSIGALVGSSLLAGAVGSLCLASANLSTKIILKYFGIEVEINVKRRDK